ncbi:VCBS repeat-containing protein [Streptomyces bambusae]|uniref:FG-GAP repeat domain-containing protein n=1 Tax=Streptomyces bambusae TaxID=1550616 RepID=UPI001CFC7E32|nr:VCBS repeat-containing protein [Streptomyces bambusae]MCB5167925.1 VCBS repeat-containing protein [Streptomyces bambusae]
MNSSRSRDRRLGRLAACTAVAALAAGTLMSVPAAADGRPRVQPEQAAPPSAGRPGPVLPQGARSGQAAAAALAPRFDGDADGIADTLYQAVNGKYFVNPGGADEHFEYGVGQATEDGSFAYKDVLPVGDFDRDGRSNLLALTADGTLALFNGADGTGTSYNPSWSGRGWQVYNKLLAPGDLTGDGRVDVLARTYDGVLYLYPSGPSAASPYGARVRIGSGWQAYDQLVGLNDTDGDGRADLAARDGSGRLYAYLGTGQPAAPFKERRQIGFGYQVYNQLAGADDIDRDGRGDMIARDPAGRLYLYKADGTGGFKPRVTSSPGWNYALLLGAQGGLPAWDRSDVVGRDTAGTLWWYWSKNDGTLSARTRISPVGDWKGFRYIRSSSLDANSYAESLEVFQNHLFLRGRDIGAGWGAYNALVGPGDLSGDGKGDLLARDTSGTLYLYRGNGAATGFAARQKIGTGWGTYNKLTGAGDFTGDGRADLIARDGSGNLYLYPGTGSSAAPFKPRVKIGTGYGIYRNLVATGDLTGDSRADLVATDSAGNLWRYTSYGPGKLTARAKIGTSWQIYPDLY